MSANGATMSTPSSYVARGKEWKRPKDGKEFVGCLVGGRQDTRKEIIDEVWKRYGIRVIKHFGDEQRKSPGSIYIDSRVEIVILLADDLHDVVLQRVLACCRGGGHSHLAINRKQKNGWDAVFLAEGFKNPPPWRDGILIDNPADPKRLEEERQAELAALEKPRTAWVDPKLAVTGKATIADKLAAIEVIEKYKPKPPEKPAMTAKLAFGGKKHEYEAKPSGPGWASELRNARIAAGHLGQNEFARMLPCGQSMLSSWEQGRTIPSYTYWLRLHELLPTLRMPEGVRGQQAYDKLVKKGAQPMLGRSDKPAEQARAAPTAEPKAPEKKAPKVETPAALAQKAEPVSPRVVLATVAPTGSEELLTINLRSGGTVSLTATVSLVKLRGEDRAFLFDLIDKLQAYEEQGKKP